MKTCAGRVTLINLERLTKRNRAFHPVSNPRLLVAFVQPEAQLSEIIAAGVTTVVGTLGTDCVSRSLDNLRAKVGQWGNRAIGLATLHLVGLCSIATASLTYKYCRWYWCLFASRSNVKEPAQSGRASSLPNTAGNVYILGGPFTRLLDSSSHHLRPRSCRWLPWRQTACAPTCGSAATACPRPPSPAPSCGT